MSRTIAITVSSDRRQDLVDRINGREGVASIAVQPGISVTPPGDVVTVQATNRAAEEVIRLVGELGILEHGSLVVAEPAALVAPAQRKAIDHETNEAMWEEMQALLRRDSNLSVNFLALMMLSGGIAGIGLLQDTLHLVVGAMLVAPGFEPLVRIAFGPTSGLWRATRKGILGTVAGYLVLALGAALGLLVTVPFDPTVPADLSSQSWVGYWTSFKWSGVAIAFLAGLAGAVIVSSHRTVFAAGVMIALALVPGMAIFGMAVALGDVALALKGLARWGVDAACVLAAGLLVLTLKRILMHRRTALF